MSSHSDSAKSGSPYVVVFGGARDHYQVALALQEEARLHRLVSELYLPAMPAWFRGLLRLADRRNRREARAHPALPAECVCISWAALVASLLNRAMPSARFVRWKDAALGRACGWIARRERLPVLAYSYYASHTFEQMPPDLLRVIFQVHPHPETVRRILGEELALSPQARNSLANEHELHLSPVELDRLGREAREAHFALTPSSFAKQSLVAAGVNPDKIAVVPYGIDSGVFKPKPFTASAGRPLRLIFVGSLVQRKGLSYLFEAMRRLQGEPVELVLAGRGARDDALLAHFADVPFRLAWNVPREELVRELQAADVFVFPSLVESFAHVILEAMAIGLPVITTTNTAGPDLLEEGRTGFVGSIRDVDFMVEKIRWFLAHREAIPAMGRACQAAAAQRTWARFRSEIRQALANFE